MKKGLVIFLIFILSLILVSCNEESETSETLETFVVIFMYQDKVILEDEYQKGDVVSFPSLEIENERVLNWTIKDSTTIFSKSDIVESDLVLIANTQRGYGISFYPSRMDTLYVFAGDMPVIPKDPKMDNQVFKGWYEDRDCLIPYNWNKPYPDVDYLTIFIKWENAKSPLYFTALKYDDVVQYEVYVTKHATGEVVIPSYNMGIKIRELYRSGEYNNATSFVIPETIDNISGSFFLTSPNLENIKVNAKNNLFSSKEGVLYRSNNTVIFYPSNKQGDTYRTNADHISVNAFSNTKNLKTLFLDKAFDISSDSFSNSSIENIVIIEEAYFNYHAFRNYEGNIFLNEESYNFNISSNINVYLKDQWSIIDGLPVSN